METKVAEPRPSSRDREPLGAVAPPEPRESLAAAASGPSASGGVAPTRETREKAPRKAEAVAAPEAAYRVLLGCRFRSRP